MNNLQKLSMNCKYKKSLEFKKKYITVKIGILEDILVV